MTKPYTLALMTPRRNLKFPHIVAVRINLGDACDMSVVHSRIVAYEHALFEMDAWSVATCGMDGVYYRRVVEPYRPGPRGVRARRDEWRFRTAEEACAFMLRFG